MKEEERKTSKQHPAVIITTTTAKNYIVASNLFIFIFYFLLLIVTISRLDNLSLSHSLARLHIHAHTQFELIVTGDVVRYLSLSLPRFRFFFRGGFLIQFSHQTSK